MDNFTEISFTTKNLDIYFIRTSIMDALKETLSQFNGNLLDVGCGKMPYKTFILNNSNVENYVGLDIDEALEYDNKIKPDFIWDGRDMPFRNNRFDCAIGTEVLEHCPDPEILMKEVLRVLKPGGIFFFTSPFLWNLHEVPNDEYRYTPFSLERHLKNSGFNEIMLHPTGGWHAALAQMLGLWVKRAPISSKIRIFSAWCLKPIITHLIKKDKTYITSFTEGQMITGLYGIAKKN